jgi:hypothetical protein
MSGSDIQSAAAAVARSARRNGASHPATHEARVDLLAAHVKRLVDDAPPLTPEQRDRLATILRGAR